MSAINKNNLLKECLQGLLVFEDRFDRVTSDDVMWICKRLSWHKLLPMAAAVSTFTQKTPEPLKTIFKNTTLQNMLREEHYHRQAMEIFAALDHAQIPYMPFKGPFWFCSIYPAYHWRHIGDIDILIPKHHVTDAGAMIEQMGYKPQYLEKSLENDLKLRGEVAFFPTSAVDTRVPVELHWQPMPSPRFLRKAFLKLDDFTGNTTADRWRDLNFALPLPEIQFFYLVLHATCQHQFARFAHVTSLVHFLQHYDHLDWSIIHNLALERQAQTPLYYALYFAHTFWPLPEPVSALMKQLEVPFRTRFTANRLKPHHIIKHNGNKGSMRRKLFRAAISW